MPVFAVNVAVKGFKLDIKEIYIYKTEELPTLGP